MKLEKSKYKDMYQKKLSYDFGNFYIFNTFVVSEISEGINFNWEYAKIVIEDVYKHFGTRDIKVSYISNRVNSYSVTPQDWLKFYQERNHMEAVAIVGYNKQGFISIVLEKIFQKARLKKFISLDDAIEWITGAKVITQVHQDQDQNH